MATTFEFAYESLLTVARNMTREQIVHMIDAINDELNYIAEILNLYDDEENEIFKDNMIRGQYLMKERTLYIQVYQTRLEEFQQDIEDEYYENVKGVVNEGE
jgi:hypothetical protein